MEMKKLIFAAAALSLAACSNESEPATDAPVALTVNADIAGVQQTRASKDSFSAADQIGVTVKDNKGGNTTGTNVLYTASSDAATFTSTAPIYFLDGKTVTFSAYWPYDATLTDDDLTIKTPTTVANQDKVDFLYGEGSGNASSTSGIDIEFNHSMSKLTFTFLAGEGASADASFANNLDESYQIEGLVLSGAFDTTTGIAEADSEADPEALSPAFETTTDGITSSLIVYPQTPKEVKLTLTYKSMTYAAYITVPAANTATPAGFQPGNNYAYTVTLNQTGLKISSSSIVDWNEVPQESEEAEYEYPHDIWKDGEDDGANSGLGYDGEEDLPIE